MNAFVFLEPAMSSSSYFRPAPRTAPLAHALAALLRAASARLDALAERVSAPATRTTEQPATHFEFHAVAGAPEGALYADGVRIGVLPGVTRL
jgi:hypothetical protein